MQSIVPLKLILPIIGLIVVFGYWIFVFIIIYHLVRFGIGTKPKIVAVIFLLGSICLFFAPVIFASGVDFGSVIGRLSQFNPMSLPTI